MLMQRSSARQIQRKNALTPGEKSGILRAQITFSQQLICQPDMPIADAVILRTAAQLATVMCPFFILAWRTFACVM
jgi:hypothetical protein